MRSAMHRGLARHTQLGSLLPRGVSLAVLCAQVTALVCLKAGVWTDQDGYYRFPVLPSGKYNIWAEKEGWTCFSYPRRSGERIWSTS
jgi:hypothetical protein